MTPREHAKLASELIEACGGLDEAANKSGCRVGRTLLSNYQTPTMPASMPADVMACLESYCGKPVYSRALFERFDAPTIDCDLKESTCEVTEDAAELQHLVREAVSKGTLTLRDIDAIREDESALEHALERVRSTLRAVEMASGRPTLRAV